MTHSDLAQQLAAARQTNTQISPELFDGLQSEAHAYELQQLVGKKYQANQIGYKVGATNETSQKMFACDAPFFGPMFDSDHHHSGKTIELQPGLLGGEAEFAFLIDRDIPGRSQLSQAQISDYIRDVHVAVELVGRRTVGEGLPSLFAAIADFGGNAAFISGPAIEDWRSIDLAAVEVVATTNGEQTNAGNGAAVLGHPLNSLLWLHEKLSSMDMQLKAGQWITTGTCLGVIAPIPDSTVEVTFTGCGDVTYRLQ